MAKENFTLKVHEFNTVLRYFCGLLGDRRKGKAMVKTNPRTKLWFRARISYLSPTFMENLPRFRENLPRFLRHLRRFGSFHRTKLGELPVLSPIK